MIMMRVWRLFLLFKIVEKKKGEKYLKFEMCTFVGLRSTGALIQCLLPVIVVVVVVVVVVERRSSTIRSSEYLPAHSIGWIPIHDLSGVPQK